MSWTSQVRSLPSSVSSMGVPPGHCYCVDEVCAADIDLAQDGWHHTLTILGKGDKPAVVPVRMEER